MVQNLIQTQMMRKKLVIIKTEQRFTALNWQLKKFFKLKTKP